VSALSAKHRMQSAARVFERVAASGTGVECDRFRIVTACRYAPTSEALPPRR
jgi:hypothetical protein